MYNLFCLDNRKLLIENHKGKGLCQLYCKTSEQKEKGEILLYAVNYFCLFLSYEGWLDS